MIRIDLIRHRHPAPQGLPGRPQCTSCGSLDVASVAVVAGRIVAQCWECGHQTVQAADRHRRQAA